MFRHINITYIAATLCAGLIIATTAAHPARAENGEITRALAGLAALGLIGAAIVDAQRDRDANVVIRTQPGAQAPLVAPGHGRYVAPKRRALRAKMLPARCLREVRLPGQPQIYGATCMQNRSVGHLPQRCRVSFTRNGRTQRGYAPGCLKQNGWRH